jgi:hypothetical protein
MNKYLRLRIVSPESPESVSSYRVRRNFLLSDTKPGVTQFTNYPSIL